jgi:hypothetical protein
MLAPEPDDLRATARASDAIPSRLESAGSCRCASANGPPTVLTLRNVLTIGHHNSEVRADELGIVRPGPDAHV